MKLSGCKAIAEKREGKNQETIFSFERSGRDWGHRWKEGRKVETAAGKKFDWLCSVSFLFGSLKSGNSPADGTRINGDNCLYSFNKTSSTLTTVKGSKGSTKGTSQQTE